MKTKGEIFNQFWEFKVQVEKQIGKKIKVLRLNSGGECTFNDLKILQARIKREMIVLYNPW